MPTNIWLGNSLGGFKTVKVVPGPDIIAKSPPPEFYIGLEGLLFTFTDGWNADEIVAAWLASDNPAISVITPSVDGVNVVFTAQSIGNDFDIVCSLKGSVTNTSSTYQQLDLVPYPSGGTFKLTVAGTQTGNITYNATASVFAAAMQTAIAAMAGFAANDVIVTSLGSGSFRFDFSQGRFIGTEVEAITATHISLTGGDATVRTTVNTVGSAAVSGTNQVSTLTFPIDGTHTANINAVQTLSTDDAKIGGVQLTIDGYGTTDVFPFTAGRSVIRTALEGIMGHGNVKVTGGPLYWPEDETYYPVRIEFIGDLSGVDIPVMVAEAINGGVNEIQKLTMGGYSTAGTFKLVFNGSAESGTIPYNATAAQVQTALVALTTIGTDEITCIGGPFVPSGSPVAATSILAEDKVIRDESIVDALTQAILLGLNLSQVATEGYLGFPKRDYFVRFPLSGFLTAAKLTIVSNLQPTTFSGAGPWTVSAGNGPLTLSIVDADNAAIPLNEDDYDALDFFSAVDALTFTEQDIAAQTVYIYQYDIFALLKHVALRSGFVDGNSVVIRMSTGPGSVGNWQVLNSTNTVLFDDLSATAEPKVVLTTKPGLYGPIQVYFQQGLGEANQPLITANNGSLTNGAVLPTTVRQGSTSTYDVVEVVEGGSDTVSNITGGTFSLVIAGVTVGNLAYNITAAALQSAINAAFNSTVCAVTGGPAPGTALVITFSGALGTQVVAISFLNALQTNLPSSVLKEILEEGQAPTSPTNIWDMEVCPGVGTLGLQAEAYLLLTLTNTHYDDRKVGTILPVGQSILSLATLSPEIIESSINEILSTDACRVTKVGNSIEKSSVAPVGVSQFMSFWYMKDLYRITFTTAFDTIQVAVQFNPGSDTTVALLGYEEGVTNAPGSDFDQYTETQRVVLGFAELEATGRLQTVGAFRYSGNFPANSLSFRYKLMGQWSDSVEIGVSGNAIAEGGSISFSWCKTTISGTTPAPSNAIILTSETVDWDSPASVIQTTIERMFFGVGGVEVSGGLRNSWLAESRLDAPTNFYQDLQVLLTGIWYSMPLDNYGYNLICNYTPPVASGSSFQKAYRMSSSILTKSLPPHKNHRERVTLSPETLVSLQIGSCISIADIGLYDSAEQVQTHINALHAEYISAATKAQLPAKFIYPIFVYGTTFADGPMEFEFSGGGAQKNPFCFLIVNSVPNITIGLIVATTPGVQGHSAIDANQLVSIVGDPFGGTFTLTWGGHTTSALAYNVSLATLQSAVSSANFSSPTITGNAAIGFTFVWAGAGGARAAITSAATLHNAGIRLQITILNIGGFGSTFRIIQVEKGGGPNNVDDRNNWSLGRCIDTGDTVVFDDSNSPVLYGLDLSSTIIIQVLNASQPTIFAHTRNRQVFDDGQKVVLLGAGTAPTGMSFSSIYTVTNVAVINANTFELLDSAGSKVFCTSPNLGEIVLAVQNLTVSIYNRLGSAQIGLPHLNDNGTIESLPQFLRAGYDRLTIGLDVGDGISLGCFDTMNSSPEITINSTGKPLITGLPSVLLLTNNEDVSLRVNSGDVGLAIYAEQVAVIGSVEILSGSLKLANSHLTSLKVAKDVKLTTSNTTVDELITIG